ncbi:hypothetical protein HZC09_05765 [Candidatus Micrarchaeota archaeon]|nr:hypothetical protein [Candidatus Micrarchaeota archaeon]
MPHKCVRCSKAYPSQSPELMKGCSCGSRVFLFIREGEQPKQTPQQQKELDKLEEDLAFLSKDKPVIVDMDAVENLRILEKGSYEFDLQSLLKGEPLVIKSDQEVYYVKLPRPRMNE